MAPAVGWIKPATSRNRLDLPQPDGPTMTENSFSSTSREMRSSAVTGCPIRGVKRRMTLSMRSLPMFGGPRASGVAGPGQQPIPDELEELVGNQAEQADHHDADEDLDRKSTRLNSSHGYISYAVFCLKKKNRGRNLVHHVGLVHRCDD